MSRSVGVVSRESEEIFRPKPERHFSISVMRADHVQDQEEREKKIGSVRKLQSPMGETENRGEENHQNIFQNPGLPIEGMNRSDDPDCNANDR